MMKIGTSGFRGIIGEDFTKENVCKIAQATCDILKKYKLKKVVSVGFDNRFMSEYFARWVVEVLSGNGVKVLFFDKAVSSPTISFAGKYFCCPLNLMITASHNPYIYNGIKLFSYDGQDLEAYLEKEYTKRVPKVKKYKTIPFEEGVENGLIEYVDCTDNFADTLVSLMKNKPNKKLKIAYNALNGSSVRLAKVVRQKLGLNFEILNEDREPTFKFSSPLPNEDKLQEYKEYAITNKLDLAFATDGDGDRVGVFDEKGNYYAGNELSALVYYYLIKYCGKKGGFVRNYSLSQLSNLVCKTLGTDIYETKIGFKYIGQTMRNNNALVGAENSGIEILGGAWTKDGMVVFVLLVDILTYFGKPLSEIFKSLKKEVGYKMHYVEESFAVKDKQKIVNALTKQTPNFGVNVSSVETLDGFKYFFEDGGFALIRFSGTENLLRIVCEENSKKAVKEIVDNIKRFVNNL